MNKRNILLLQVLLTTYVLSSCGVYRFDQLRLNESKRNDIYIIEALEKSKDGYIRAQAAQSLGRLKSKRAVKPLINKLDDIDWIVRYYSVWALGQIGDKSSLKALKKRLEIEEEFHVVQEIKLTLENLNK